MASEHDEAIEADPSTDHDVATTIHDATADEAIDDVIEGGDDDFQLWEPIDLTNPDVVASARRKHGKGAATMLAAGMFGLDKILTEKKKPDSVQVQEAPSDPVDVDTDGITVVVDTLAMSAPALERKAPVVGAKKKPRR